MDQISLHHPSRKVHATIQLTGSKSESNRALLLQELSNGTVQIVNLSEADDTRLMQESLKELNEAISLDNVNLDVGPAGTVMRFLTALLTLRPGQYHITGSRRMKERPIALLVEALQTLGGRITYADRVGFPPLNIEGGFKQKTNEVQIPGDVSSQYLSALLMIAPALENGLKLQIIGELTSKPYLSMTLNMLAEAGIEHQWHGDLIHIAPQSFRPCVLEIEPDWSAASYWYSILALAEEGEIQLPGLKENSLQGDQAIVKIMERFGVYTTFNKEGVLLRKGPLESSEEVLDFTECPDLAQTVIACAAALKMDLRATGLHTLRIKETDRITALQQEIGKFGAILTSDDDGIFQLDTQAVNLAKPIRIHTYEDHRMAMAFAPLALMFDQIIIETPEVVEKSYPNFWVHLLKAGFCEA